MRIINITNGRELAHNALIANTLWKRMRGLLGRNLSAGEALVLPHCQSIHTFGMGYAIDVAFVDRNLFIVHMLQSFPPQRLGPFIWRAAQAIELPAGTLSKNTSNIGHQLKLE